MDIRGRQTKKCPRCQCKCLINQPACPDCGLIFSRLEEATNAAAADRIKHKEKYAVIYTKQVPKDRKRWKLTMYTIFLGLFGGHYFYIRRYALAALDLCGFLLLSVCTIFNAKLVGVWDGKLIGVLAFFVGLYGLWWIIDIIRVCMGKFKIPVSLPREEQAEVIVLDPENSKPKKERRKKKPKSVEIDKDNNPDKQEEKK